MMKRPDRTRRDGKCVFCEQSTVPTFLNPSQLKAFLTDRGKIVSRSRSSVCLAHQRSLTQAMKRARYMALIPYVSMPR